MKRKNLLINCLITFLVAGSLNLYSQQCAKSEDSSKLKFEIKEVDAIKAVTMKASATMAEIGQKMGEIYTKLYEYAGVKGLNMTGAPFCVYYSFDPQGSTDFECGIPVDSEAEGSGEIGIKDFPEMKVVSTLYVGAYEKMEEPYNAINVYIKENNLIPSGPSWEIYLTNPNEETDPNNNKTIIYFPVE